MRNSLLGLVKGGQTVSNRGVWTKTQKIPILIYILKTQSINQLCYFTKNGHFRPFVAIPRKSRGA
nr:MAG TPA: hypothetical protein [Caudoviricetes sp.]